MIDAILKYTLHYNHITYTTYNDVVVLTTHSTILLQGLACILLHFRSALVAAALLVLISVHCLSFVTLVSTIS